MVFRPALVFLWLCVGTLFVAAQTAPSLPVPSNPFLPPGAKDRGWPSIRGPDFDGHSPEIQIADHWPAGGPPVLWTRELGQGYSAFVAEGTRVYTQGQTLGGQYIYCLHADTGETLWEHRYDWPYDGLGVYPGPRATPALHDGRIYLAAPSGHIECLHAKTGQKIWSRNVIEEYKGKGGVNFGYACSPTVIEGLVILPVGGKSSSLVALNAEDGTEVWAAGSDPASYSSVLPITRAGRQLVVGYLENSLVIHDLQTGAQLLRLNLSRGYDEHSAWPIYREPYLWLAAPFRAGSQLLELPESFDNETTLGTVWNSRILSNDVVSSVLVDGHIYGFDIFDVQAKTQRPSRGKFRCIELETGAERWSQGTNRLVREDDDRDPTEIGQAGIVAADGKLLLLNELGELILLRATPEKCDELARASVLGGELTWTPPVLHRGRIYVRNHSRAVCIYVGEQAMLNASLPTLTVADIPQTEYRDLAGVILAIEPEYVFDVPSVRWLVVWYFASLAILAGSGLLAILISWIVPFSRRAVIRRWVYRGTAFLAGALGTTVLSAATQDFVFTWPVCLFVAFEPVIAAARQRNQLPAHPWAERFTLVAFFAVCLIYFAICRRLSLVFEWSFLIGFVGSVPFLWLKRWSSIDGRWGLVTDMLLIGVAFTAFYICGALPLLLK